MSKLLFDESPLIVQPTLAKAIGLNEAIILQQIHYWMQTKSGKEIDGARWIFNSLSDWQTQFGWWSESTIFRTLQNLEDAGLIKTGNFNQRKGDRTKWYTLDYAVYALLEALIEQEQWLEEQAATQAENAAPVVSAVDVDAETVGERNSIFQNGTASCQNGTTLPETSTEISTSFNNKKADDNFQKAWNELCDLLIVINPSVLEKFGEIWDEFPDLRRHEFALKATRENANPVSFRYYETCFLRFDPDKTKSPQTQSRREPMRAPSPYKLLTD